MRALLSACLFVLACKGEESKPAPSAPKPEEPTKVERHRPAPSLPSDVTLDDDDDDRPRPRLPDGAREPVDWNDPAVREEMRARMEERRKRREAMLDTNKDGVVSPEERQARLAPMIDRFDGNNDGKLTVEELAASDRRMGFDDPGAVDTDKNGEISLAELDAAITARREERRARWRGRDGAGSAQGVGPD